MRFTIRDVLWLTVVVAALIARWQERLRHNADVDKFNALSSEHEELKGQLKDGGYKWISIHRRWRIVRPGDSD
jgi:hypothetical protein